MESEDLNPLGPDPLDDFTQDGHTVYESQWQEQTSRIRKGVVWHGHPPAPFCDHVKATLGHARAETRRQYGRGRESAIDCLLS
ncbi:hypothetical protein MK280_13110 [Myxococcota bacterium]|nr:hypothetical protein [Myxococcota bacterium]